MNKWECAHPGCKSSAVGVGGAVGLRAIGWWFVHGGPLLCPSHRPDGRPCSRDGLNPKCSSCAAENDASAIQYRAYYDWPKLF